MFAIALAAIFGEPYGDGGIVWGFRVLTVINVFTKNVKRGHLDHLMQFNNFSTAFLRLSLTIS
jgi:hypothetical protein